MKITKNSYVSLAYKLTVEGKVADQANADAPLDFIFGVGMLLPNFESNVEGKEVGDKFAFTLSPEEGYGEIIKDAIVELPKNIFEVEGKFDDSVVHVGATLPMMDNEGHQMYGRVEEVGEQTVKMNFNHPMAGQTLNFEGEVVAVREATDADMAQFMPQGGGCSCGDGGCGDSGCNDGGCDSEGSCCK